MSVESLIWSYLVSFKERGRKVSPRFHLFVFDVNQGSEEAG